MISRRLVSLVVACLLGLPPAAEAWGWEAHRFVMDRAIALLPTELRPLFERYRATVVERSIDPDTWRTAGFGDEGPRHQLQLDWGGYGKYPFAELPRDYAAAVAKFGRTTIEENGTLPWRVEESHGSLRRAFEAYRRPATLRRFELLFFAAWLSHYVQDAVVPFHATVNFDGQETGQDGLHARWETALFERYRAELQLSPQPLPAVTNPRDFIFDRLLEGNELVPVVLEHDRKAIGRRDVYDEGYFTAFFAATRPVLERRLSLAIAATAAMIAGAWEEAGRPAVPVDVSPPTPQRRAR
jgi:hypothetical protein